MTKWIEQGEWTNADLTAALLPVIRKALAEQFGAEVGRLVRYSINKDRATGALVIGVAKNALRDAKAAAASEAKGAADKAGPAATAMAAELAETKALLAAVMAKLGGGAVAPMAEEVAPAKRARKARVA